ncbi:MAG: DUF5640 domain-containing protein [Coriobacteriia bacterium]|nr:DUF5640 domain-containing protein [Coriobacteriia bacterium]
MKMKRYILILAIVLAGAFLLVGCGGSDDIYGTWLRDSDSETTYTFNEDGTGAFDIGFAVLDFDWTADSDAITIVNEDQNVNDTLEFSVDGDTLTLTNSSGDSETYTKVE